MVRSPRAYDVISSLSFHFSSSPPVCSFPLSSFGTCIGLPSTAVLRSVQYNLCLMRIFTHVLLSQCLECPLSQSHSSCSQVFLSAPILLDWEHLEERKQISIFFVCISWLHNIIVAQYILNES